MPPTTTHIPLPGQGGRRSSGLLYKPAFGGVTRGVLAVLAWIAFGVAGYLAYTSVTGSSVAGCGVEGANGCDIVLTSSWSKWLGVPVAVLGLACYASLASLAVVLGLRSPTANRWITTAFVMLSVVAALASIWFIGVQVFAIGQYCKFCLVTDACGIVLGIIATAAAFKVWSSRRSSQSSLSLQPGLLGLRPSATVSAPSVSAALVGPPPSLLAAFGGAIPLVAILIGGQLLFASKTFKVEKIALNQKVSLDSPADAATAPANATTRVAMRIPSETENTPASDLAKPNEAEPSAPAKDAAPAVSPPEPSPKNSGQNNASPTPPAEPANKRLVSFLGGKLTLDVYRHPLIGAPDAPHIAIEMVSYDCPHCRKMYPLIHEALDRYGDQVALLIMPIPLDKDCNSLVTDPTIHHPGACGTTRLVLGVARLNPSDFGRFHDFLMANKDKPPGMEKIVPKAYGLTNPDKLRELRQSPETQKQMEGYVKLYGKLMEQNKSAKSFGLPVQILGDKVMSGSVEKVEDVFKAWEENLGVKPI